MKKIALIGVLVLLVGSLVILNTTFLSAAKEEGRMETAKGMVTNIDLQGKAIMISTRIEKQAEDVGVIINDETLITVKGKKTILNDIKPGDMVKIRYLKSNDPFAKEIVKK